MKVLIQFRTQHLCENRSYVEIYQKYIYENYFR